MSSLRNLSLNKESWLALYLAGFTVRQLSSISSQVEQLFDRHEARFVLAQGHSVVKDKQKVRWLEYISGQGKIAGQIEECMRWQQGRAGRYIISCSDVHYPPLLLETNSPPLLFFAAGQVDELSKPVIAMVGSRNPTIGGLENAHSFAREIAARNVPVVSGMALGIDSACHQGALLTGSTIAVLGTGINVVYPKRNTELAGKICERGVIISEFMPDTAPLARHFPQRNRIISGMSLGVIVVEAARQSGSLITARLALDANREVFAIPGSIHNPLSKGCHQLIREGATLVESVPDILEQVGVGVRSSLDGQKKIDDSPSSDIGSLSQDARLVLSSVGFEPTPIDVITQRSGLDVSLVNSLLIELTLEAHVSSVVGGYLRS